MAEWLVEEGIGEHRAIRLDGATIVEARLDWPGALTAGQVEDAALISKSAGSTRGTAKFASGEEALVDNLPLDASEGSMLRLAVTRSAMRERGRGKLAQSRPTDQPIRPAPILAETLRGEGRDVRVVRRFPDCDWDELWNEAWSGEVAFSGGSLWFSDTPAMTLIDVDGDGDPTRLAKAAVPAIAAALRRFDLGGSIGIDFPTIQSKQERKRVDGLLAGALADWPHERTAINGFGFVQIVAKLSREPVTRRLANSRVGVAARRLLRQAERMDEAGVLQLTCHPALKAKLKQQWLDDLARRTGRELRIEIDPSLALEGAFAQAVSR